MKLQHLRALLAVVDAGFNITVAAEKLFATQPGVSKTLAQFEDELGFPLFVRKGKALVGLTPPARDVVTRARKVMQEIDNIRAIAADWRGEDEGELRIATSHTQARYVLPNVVMAFREAYPKIAVHLLQGTTEQIGQWLTDGEADLAIASGDAEEFKSLLRFDVFEWQRLVVVPKNHPLAALKRPVTLADLSAHPIVSYASTTRPDSGLRQAFATHNLPLNLSFTARDADIIKTYVKTGMGVGIIAGMAYDADSDKDLVALSADGLFPTVKTWIGLRSDTVLRKHTLNFILRFAPQLNERDILSALGSEDYKTVMYYI